MKASLNHVWTIPVGACAVLVVASNHVLAQVDPPPTTENCWNEFMSHMADCCEFDDPDIEAACLNTAKDALEFCLFDVQSAGINGNNVDSCWADYVQRLIQCDDGIGFPCDGEEEEATCIEGAKIIYNWCKVHGSAGASLGDLQWRWGSSDLPSPIAVGEHRLLAVSTTNPFVTGVTYFLIQDTVTPGTAKIVKVAEAVHMGGQWIAGVDTGAWPIADDSRVWLVARTELGNAHGQLVQVLVDVDNPADFNDDGLVNALDLASYQDAYRAGEERADLNGDGAVDTLDVIAFQTLLAGG